MGEPASIAYFSPLLLSSTHYFIIFLAYGFTPSSVKYGKGNNIHNKLSLRNYGRQKIANIYYGKRICTINAQRLFLFQHFLISLFPRLRSMEWKETRSLLFFWVPYYFIIFEKILLCATVVCKKSTDLKRQIIFSSLSRSKRKRMQAVRSSSSLSKIWKQWKQWKATTAYENVSQLKLYKKSSAKLASLLLNPEK